MRCAPSRVRSPSSCCARSATSTPGSQCSAARSRPPRRRDGAGVHDWIPGPLNRESSGELPLGVAEIAELYRLNARVSAADEDVLEADRPAVDELPPPRELAALLDELKRIEQVKPANPKL